MFTVYHSMIVNEIPQSFIMAPCGMYFSASQLCVRQRKQVCEIQISGHGDIVLQLKLVLGLGRLCSHFCPLFYSFISINSPIILCNAPIVIMLLDFTHKRIKICKQLQLGLSLSWWLYSSITESCMQSFNEDFCCKHKKLVTVNEATVHLVERDCKFAMFQLPDQKSILIMPA